jgi:hypothetical protein
MAIFFVAAIWPAGRRARMAFVVLCVGGFAEAIVYANHSYFQACYPEDAVPGMLASYQAGTGFEGMFEYAPPGSDVTTIARGLPDACLVSDANAELGKPYPDDADANPIWAPEQGSCIAKFSWDSGTARNPEHLRMSGTAPQAGWLVLRLTAFPAWRVQLNEVELESVMANPMRARPDGLIEIPVRPGSFDIAVDWTTSADVWLGRWVSVVSIFLAIEFAWFEHKLGCPHPH